MIKKAERLRKETGDSRYYAPMEKEEKLPLGKRIYEIVGRPFKILVQEPMLIAVTIYMSVRRSLISYCPNLPLVNVVRLWMHLPPFRGIPGGVYRWP